MVTEWKDFATLVMSTTSLWFAFKANTRANPRLQLNMWVAMVFRPGVARQSDAQYLSVQVVNMSTRPVTVTNIGGHYNGRIVRTVAFWLGLHRKLRSFVWQDVQPLIFDGGKPRVIKDGEAVSHQILLGSAIRSIEEYRKNIDRMKSIWVSDAAGREYELDRRALRGLKTQLKGIPQS